VVVVGEDAPRVVAARAPQLVGPSSVCFDGTNNGEKERLHRCLRRVACSFSLTTRFLSALSFRAPIRPSVDCRQSGFRRSRADSSALVQGMAARSPLPQKGSFLIVSDEYAAQSEIREKFSKTEMFSEGRDFYPAERQLLTTLDWLCILSPIGCPLVGRCLWRVSMQADAFRPVAGSRRGQERARVSKGPTCIRTKVHAELQETNKFFS
jgi:hypothetical protein